jgi:lysozyme
MSSLASRHKGKISFAVVISMLGGIAPFFEGTLLKSYRDGGGVWTVCTGDTRHAKPGFTATPEECKRWFNEQAVAEVEFVEQSLANADITNEQLVAFADFTYNLGRGAWLRSGMIQMMEQGQVTMACNKLLEYNKGPKMDPKTGAQVLNPKTGKPIKIVYKGLVKRRNAEWLLCMGKSWKQ